MSEFVKGDQITHPDTGNVVGTVVRFFDDGKYLAADFGGEVWSLDMKNCQLAEGLFQTLDSGERVDFPSGMRRDTDKGKPRFDLIPLPMLRRLAELYARGAEKYGDSNWMLADSPEEVARFKASGFRHWVSWLEGDRSEDHAMGAVFNIFAAETIEKKIGSLSTE